MEPQLNVTFLEGNRFVFGDSEMRLLDAIAREGTLTDGAATLGLSYRVAWGKLRAAEATIGTRLVETTVGGSGGGSSRLTTEAQHLVAQYTRFRDAVGAFALAEFEKCFGQNAACSKFVLNEGDGLMPKGDEGTQSRGEMMGGQAPASGRVTAETAEERV